MTSAKEFVTLEDIRDAESRIRRYVTYCPPVYSPFLSNESGKSVYLKMENLQPTKVFKLRGATNKISRLNNVEKIVTASSGNHGLSVAYASRIFNKKATIFVPEWANPDKIKMITSLGAEVNVGGDSYEAANSAALAHSENEGSVFIHPFEDPLVIAGQGTIGLEISRDLPNVDTVIVPVGGGGLISGISLALKWNVAGVKVVGVQGENNPTMVQSFYGDGPKEVPLKSSIADGLITKTTSDITLGIIKENVDRMVTVSENELRDAVKLLLVNEHTLVEPSGAASTAALLSGKAETEGSENVVVVLSGGNISIELLKELLRE